MVKKLCALIPHRIKVRPTKWAGQKVRWLKVHRSIKKHTLVTILIREKHPIYVMYMTDQSPSFPPRAAPENQGLNDIEINPTIVQRVMSKAKNKKQIFGWARQSTPIFPTKTHQNTLSFPLAILFSIIFSTLKNLPSEWKHSITFKKGDPSAVSKLSPPSH